MTKKTMWKLRIVFWAFTIIIAMAIGAFCAVGQVSDGTFRIILVTYVVVMIGAWLAVNILYTARLAKKVNGLLPILREENDPDRYLEELTGLIGNADSKAFRSVYKLNCAAAYCDKEEYEKARSILLEMEPRNIPGPDRLVYLLDMALIHMHLGEDEAALSIWNERGAEFEKFRENDNMGAAVASLRIFSLIAEGQRSEALDEIGRCREKWTRKREIKEWNFLEKRSKE